MCVDCFLDYFHNRITPDIDSQILEAIITGISEETIPCESSDHFENVLGTVKLQLSELGFSVSNIPIENNIGNNTEPNIDYLSGDRTDDTDDDTVYSWTTESSDNVESDSGNSTNGESENTDPNNTSTTEEGVTILGTLSMLNGHQIVLRVAQETDKKLENPVKVAKMIIGTDNNEEEIVARVSKVCSSYLLPLSSKKRHWFNQVFNAIPFYHPYRLIIIKQALKILNMPPSEFYRTKDRTIELTQEALHLSKSDCIEACQICGENLIDVCPSFDLSGSKDTCYLYCGDRFTGDCKHNFCYACYRRLQLTYLGDYCPSCRAPIKQKNPLLLKRKVCNMQQMV